MCLTNRDENGFASSSGHKSFPIVSTSFEEQEVEVNKTSNRALRFHEAPFYYISGRGRSEKQEGHVVHLMNPNLTTYRLPFASANDGVIGNWMHHNKDEPLCKDKPNIIPDDDPDTANCINHAPTVVPDEDLDVPKYIFLGEPKDADNPQAYHVLTNENTEFRDMEEEDYKANELDEELANQQEEFELEGNDGNDLGETLDPLHFLPDPPENEKDDDGSSVYSSSSSMDSEDNSTVILPFSSGDSMFGSFTNSCDASRDEREEELAWHERDGRDDMIL